MYYEKKLKNYDLMKKYYLIGIERKNKYAMNNLACYYFNIEKNYDLARKYWIMAIKKGYYELAVNNIRLYYKNKIIDNNTSEEDLDIIFKYNIDAKFKINTLMEHKFIVKYYDAIILNENFKDHHNIIKLYYKAIMEIKLLNLCDGKINNLFKRVILSYI
jgi:TPR repeat protein